MRGLKQNLIYWGRTLEWLYVAMLVGVACYALVMGFMEGGFSGQEFINSILGYCWVFVCISVLVNAFSAVNTYFPLTISMGSTRKASYTAMQIVQHLLIVQCFVIGAIAYYLLDREVFEGLARLFPAVIGSVLLLLTVSNITCICAVRFGKAMGVVAYIFCLLVVLLMVVVVIASSVGEEEVFLGGLTAFVKGPGLFLTGILGDCVSIGVYYHVLKKKDLQF